MLKKQNIDLSLGLDDEPIVLSNKSENLKTNNVYNVLPNNFVPPQIGFKKQSDKKIAQYFLPVDLIEKVKNFCKSRGYSITEVVEYCLEMGIEFLKKGE